MDHAELLFLSLRAPGFALRSLEDIARVSRANNQALGLTGRLAFDGLRFAGFLEGPHDALRAVAERIDRDARHVDIRRLHEAGSTGTRRFAGWEMAYLLANDRIEALPALTSMQGEAAVAYFVRCLPRPPARNG